MLKEFKGHPLIYKVVMASSDPLETLHNIRIGKYSYKTLEELAEFLDVRDTINENAAEAAKVKGNK